MTQPLKVLRLQFASSVALSGVCTVGMRDIHSSVLVLALIATVAVLAMLAAVLWSAFTKSKVASFRLAALVSICITGFLVYWFVPQCSDMLTDAGLKRDELPASTKDVILACDFLRYCWYVVLAGTAAIFVLYEVFVKPRLRRTIAGRADQLIPVGLGLLAGFIVCSMFLPLNDNITHMSGGSAQRAP